MERQNSVSVEKALRLSIRNVEQLSTAEKNEYFKVLREYCHSLGNQYSQKITLTQRIISKIGYKLRHFPLEITGIENIPKGGCLVVCNHSNTHDAFVMAEALTSAGVPSTFLAAVEGLSSIELGLFKSVRSTMINRADKNSTNAGLYDFTGKLINGDTGVIFGESTWNLHPYKPMQNIKTGSVKAAAISGKPIVPMIMEYVEVPEQCSKEKELYTKCVVVFEKAISVDCQESLIEQTDYLQSVMEKMRKDIWKKENTYREGIEDINPQTYVNHTWLKKFGSPLFEADSEKENKMIHIKPGETLENEWHIDKDGIFKPGIILKEDTHSFFPL